MSRQEQLNLELSKFINMPEANLLVKYGKPDVVTQINENTKMYSYHSVFQNYSIYREEITGLSKPTQFNKENNELISHEGIVNALETYSTVNNPFTENDYYKPKECIKKLYNFTRYCCRLRLYRRWLR